MKTDRVLPVVSVLAPRMACASAKRPDESLIFLSDQRRSVDSVKYCWRLLFLRDAIYDCAGLSHEILTWLSKGRDKAEVEDDVLHDCQARQHLHLRDPFAQ